MKEIIFFIILLFISCLACDNKDYYHIEKMNTDAEVFCIVIDRESCKSSQDIGEILSNVNWAKNIVVADNKVCYQLSKNLSEKEHNAVIERITLCPQ